MAAKSAIAAAFAAVLAASVGVCGVAHAERCSTEFYGDVSWCPSSGTVKNISDDMVIGLTPEGLTPAPRPTDGGPTLAGWVISGVIHDGALLVPPGASAQIWGPTDVYYDSWGTVALQAGTALCNGTKLCKAVLKSFPNFYNCVQGAANQLDVAITGVWPDAFDFAGYFQAATACRSAVEDLKRMQETRENKRVVVEEGKRSLATDVLMREIPKDAGLKPINRAKFNILEFGKVVLKGLPR